MKAKDPPLPNTKASDKDIVHIIVDSLVNKVEINLICFSTLDLHESDNETRAILLERSKVTLIVDEMVGKIAKNLAR